MLVQTRERIIRAFYELEKVKHIDKITIKDIVEQCGLTRKTFYYYFRDIYDLMDAIADPVSYYTSDAFGGKHGRSHAGGSPEMFFPVSAAPSGTFGAYYGEP